MLPKTRLSCWIAPLIKTCLVWASSASGFCNCSLKKTRNFVNYWRKFLRVSPCSEARHFKGHIYCVSSKSSFHSATVRNVTTPDILLLNIAVPYLTLPLHIPVLWVQISVHRQFIVNEGLCDYPSPSR